MALFVDATPAVSAQERIQAVRQAMLSSLGHAPPSEEQSRVWGRVLYAQDIQTLWYLRSDVMTLLAQPLGESAARAHLGTITALFDGLLPAAQKARLKGPRS